MPAALTVVFAMLCPIAAYYFIKSMEQSRFLKAVLLKGLATVCCIGVAAVSLFNAPNHAFAVNVVLGLFFGFVGDELLALRFVYPEKLERYFLMGAAFFFIGHVFYLIALLSVAPKAWIAALILNALVLALEYINSKRHKLYLGRLYVPMGIYCAFVCFMGCTAVSAMFWNFGVGTFFFAVAGVCFIVSDSILSVQSFSDHPSNGKNATLHILYWSAQLLIALSPMFVD